MALPDVKSSQCDWQAQCILQSVQVIQDLYEECGKYGQLLHVIVPRPPNPASAMELFGSNNYGKVCYAAVRP